MRKRLMILKGVRRGVCAFVGMAMMAVCGGAVGAPREVDPSESVDPLAMAALDKTYAMIEKMKSVSVRFELEVDSKQTDKKDKLQGRIKVMGDKFKLDINGITTYFNGETEWVFDEKAKEVMVSEPDKAQLAQINPLTILKSYKSGFKMQYIGADNAPGGTVDIMDIFPNDRNSPYARITITTRQKDGEPVCIRTQGKNGVLTTVTIKEFMQMAMKESEFALDVAKLGDDVEVTDLR